MALEDKIEKIASVNEKEMQVDKIESKVAERTQPVEGKFESVMDKKLPEQDVAAKTAASEKPNVEDIAREQSQMQTQNNAATSQDLVAKTTEASQKIEQIKAELETPDLEIKKPVRRLMRNKLTHITDDLRIAMSKAGTEPVQVPEIAGNQQANPATKFFDHLTHAQYQLDHLGSYLQAMVDTDKDLAPANMLAIQIKVNKVQQELEFFTNLLNKSLESTKALMNVQV